jgi:hypothetical protein
MTETPSSNPARPKSRLLSILKKSLLTLVILLAIFAVIVALQPADYNVTRSIIINATPVKAFDNVNDFHRWNAWSPWAKLDPNMKATHEGSPSGKGAIYKWIGNDKVGEGKMTILDSLPADTVKIKLDFLKPFEDTAETTFTFKPENVQATQTKVTWSMAGKKNFFAKAICLFTSMDKMLGPDFERGLANLKSTTESHSTTTPATTVP